jgi:Mn2+/Fe2+ NRAMP family transporter
LLIYGLYITRKQSNNYSVVSYFNNNGDNCSFAKNGVLRTSGDVLNITLPFLAFILILLYSYEPTEIKIKYVYIFSYGILLGIIVSGISYFGMEYFLEKQPEKECNSIQECLIKQMPEPVINDIDLPDLPNIDSEDFHLPKFPNIDLPKNLDANLKSSSGFFNKNKISIFNLILLIFLILVAIYLIYYNLTRI